jgi:hypothetical protein
VVVAAGRFHAVYGGSQKNQEKERKKEGMREKKGKRGK